MLPPVLEIYVVWHPKDVVGAEVARHLGEHFHGTIFSGLIGGAVEVYIRSEGWRSAGDAPRPIPLPDEPPPNDLAQARYTAIVPLLGIKLAAAVESPGNPWRAYVQRLADAQQTFSDRVGLYPALIDAAAVDGTELGRIFHRLGRLDCDWSTDPGAHILCRDLSQSIAQLASDVRPLRLRVFISHTFRAGLGEENEVQELINRVRWLIQRTHLESFFDHSDLEPGGDWDAKLRSSAATSALLALRTDLYASRDWCQREVLIAKREGMPIVILDALGRGEERGSFLMDHVPRVPVRVDTTVEGAQHWRDADIILGLNLLVDECLKRVLWRRQAELARERTDMGVTWWAPHAPEPATLASWLLAERSAGRIPERIDRVCVLHPDPPLGADERAVLQELARLIGVTGELDIMTPRLLAARGG